MTVPGSSSSAIDRPETLAVDLAAAGLLGSLPAAFAAGGDRDLLEPLRFVDAADALPEAAPAVDRVPLAAALRETNAAYGHPGADRLSALLADPATRTVVTGQQPGLFGGPLYTLSKAVAAARWADRLAAKGAPALALFWVHNEDHDFAEVARTIVFTADGPESFDLGEDPSPLLPVGMRSLGDGVDRILAALGERVPGERYAEWIETLARWYRPEARFGEAFCRLLVHILGDRCPLLVDGMLPAVKRAQRPYLERLVRRRTEIEHALAGADRRIGDRGHPLQVSPQPGAAHLFLLHRGERRRVEWGGGERFSLRGLEESGGEVSTLLRTVEENPGVVSAGVLARPALQDAILGTTLQVLGPGELSYMPQAAVLYPLLEVPPPSVALRPQALVLESHQIDKLVDLGVPLRDLVAPELELEKRLARRRHDDPVAPARRKVEDALVELKAPAVDLDPNLARPWEKTRRQVLNALDTFAGKVDAALARQDRVAHQRAVDLRTTCRPLGAAQERMISAAHFAGKYGRDFTDAFWEQFDLDPIHLQVIRL